MFKSLKYYLKYYLGFKVIVKRHDGYFYITKGPLFFRVYLDRSVYFWWGNRYSHEYCRHDTYELAKKRLINNRFEINMSKYEW